jgi:hypothetical protein
MPTNERVPSSTAALFQRIRNLPDSETEALPKRRRILREALASFNARLATLPERERNATLSLLYGEIIETLFHFHRCIEAAAARRNGVPASRTEKFRLLSEYRATLDELARIYDVDDE